MEAGQSGAGRPCAVRRSLVSPALGVPARRRRLGTSAQSKAQAAALGACGGTGQPLARLLQNSP